MRKLLTILNAMVKDSSPWRGSCPAEIAGGRWTARIGLGEQVVTTKTLRRRFFALPGRLTRSARRLTLHFPKAGLGKTNSAAPWRD